MNVPFVQSKTTTINNIERWIRRFKSETKEFRLELRVHPSMAEYLRQGTISRLTKIMFKSFVKVKLMIDPSVPVGSFRFISIKQGKDVTDRFAG